MANIIVLTPNDAKGKIGIVVNNIVSICDHRTDKATKDCPHYQYTTLYTIEDGMYRVNETLEEIIKLANS